jgi:hypothetical protein
LGSGYRRCDRLASESITDLPLDDQEQMKNSVEVGDAFGTNARMRNFIATLIVAALLVPAAAAQERTSYFLIDASGSMDGKIDAAEEKISRLIDRVKQANQLALVSRTYFRARTRQDCWKQVKISAPVPAAQSVRDSLSFTNDFTPLGAALEAAIIEAGDKPADIYLVTDENQTEACGVDVCAVAAAHLPKTNINVLSIPVGSKPADHDRLGCLEGVQGKAGIIPSLPKVAEAKGSSTTRERKSAEQPWIFVEDTVRFFEYWLWFIGFASIAWWGVRFGYRHLAVAVRTESETRDIQVLRDKMVTGDDTAAPAFLKLVSTHEANIKSDNEEALKHPVRHWFSLHWVLCLGLLALVPLAVLPDWAEVGFWSYGGAKEAAWRVLNSDFATAFAAAWIAVGFFAGSQLQREAEAKRTYTLAATDAEEVRNARETADRSYAAATLANARNAIGSLPFDLDAPRIDETQDAAVFRRVVEAAKLLAQRGQYAPANKTEMEREAERLQSLGRGPTTIAGWVFGRVKFGTFLERMIADPAVPTSDVDWPALAKAFADDNRDQQLLKLRAVDKALTQQAVSNT